jgi:hypothetical protein
MAAMIVDAVSVTRCAISGTSHAGITNVVMYRSLLSVWPSGAALAAIRGR